MSYTAKIDNGQGGDTTITADSAAEALVKAIEWAREGDWPDEGCDITLSVTDDDDDSDTDEQEVHILSVAEKQAETLDAAGEVLAEDEGEFTTVQVIRIDDKYYHRRLNGGARGAWDTRSVRPGQFYCHNIARAEARRILLEMGLDPVAVADKTEDR